MIMNEISYILITFILNLVLFNQYRLFAKKLNLYDLPDGNRKIHKIKVPIVGGLIFFINIFFYLFSINFFDFNEIFFSNKRELFSFYIGCTLIFFIGFYDDKYNLKPNTKLLISIFTVIVSINLSETFIITELNFLFLDKTLFLYDFSKVFTILSIIIFLNAFNMMDGINGLSVSYFLICILYLFFNVFNLPLFINLFICTIFFLYKNFKGKMFLGDNGSLLLGFILSLLFIKTYNQEKIFADQIILLMLLPGIDMLRVAIIRILFKKHPFIADKTHLHHLLMRATNVNFSYLIIISIILTLAIISLTINYIFINLILIFIVTILYMIFFITSK